MTNSIQTPPPGYDVPDLYKPEFDSQRFKDLMLHIAHEGKSDPHLGMIKMCKIIFYCDFNHYWLHGTSITGATYVKAPRGPLPNRHCKAAIGALVREEIPDTVRVHVGTLREASARPDARPPRPHLPKPISGAPMD